PITAFRINEARKASDAESLTARQVAYAADMNYAHAALNEGDTYRAKQLLERHRPKEESEIQNPKPETDLRGWEWRYLWQQCQGDERSILGYHTNGATTVGILSDGKTVFSAGRDKCVRLWNLETRQPVGVLEHPQDVIGAAVSPDGKWLATVMERVQV